MVAEKGESEENEKERKKKTELGTWHVVRTN